jgi:MFS family permease
MVILSEPISLTIIFPFVYFMVKDFGIPEEQIGYYVGFIASSFSFAQFLTAYLWGKVSDRLGRRPVLLIGLIGNAVTTCLFGTSHSLAWAISMRAACGLLNGNVAIAKSIVAEIVVHAPQHTGTAYSLIGLSFGVGFIIGPSLGGLLSHPAKQFPIFKDIDFLVENPYFLPCLISSLFSVVGFIVGYAFLPETCSVKLGSSEEQDDAPENDETVTEDSPLISSQQDCDSSIWRSVPSIVAYGILAFQGIIYMEIIPLWTAARSPLGLEWKTKELGLCLSFIGVFSCFCQIFLYPFLAKIYPPETLFEKPLPLYLLTLIACPMISSYLTIDVFWNGMVFPAVLFVLCFKNALDNIISTSIIMLVTNFLT